MFIREHKPEKMNVPLKTNQVICAVNLSICFFRIILNPTAFVSITLFTRIYARLDPVIRVRSSKYGILMFILSFITGNSYP